MRNYFTSESVTEGHPDKICDQISDAILDAYLKEDENSHVACETCVTTNFVLVMGEVSSKANVNIEKIVRDTIVEIGYDDDKLGFNGHNLEVINKIHQQSEDIRMGVDKEDIGAGDQGIMFGFACDETKNYMPLAISIAHEITKELARLRKEKILDYLLPDGKSQVTIVYENGIAKYIDTILISTQHKEYADLATIKKDLEEHIISKIIDKNLLNEKTKILVNPTGRFVIGGPNGDSGLTGRKIIVDTYGGYSKHGGGAFSGKDATKVDRSAAYMARYIAKNLVAAGVAKKIEIQLSYAIGISSPISINVNTYNSSIISEEQIIEIINDVFDLKLGSILKELDLRKPNYKKTATYGHFGRDDLNMNYEKLNYVSIIKQKIRKFI